MSGEKKRGGARPGAGRKAIDGETRLAEIVRARVTLEQAATFERLGGAAWLRRTLDEAAKKARLEGRAHMRIDESYMTEA